MAFRFRVGGETMDDSIVRFIEQYNLSIGERMARDRLN